MRVSVTRWSAVLCVVLFVSCASQSRAADERDAESLVKTIQAVTNLRAADAKPFEMNVSFTAQVKNMEDGHFTLKWAKSNLWSEEVTLGQYHEMDVRKGDTLYVSRNLPFTSLRVTELKELLEIDPLSARIAKFWDVGKVKERTRNGVRLECIEFHLRRGLHSSTSSRELCVDPSSKAPLSEEYKIEDESRRMEFADYQAFRDHQYPRKLKLLVNTNPVITADVVQLKDASFDDASFVAPPGAIARRQCDQGMTPPVAVSTPDPDYPALASGSPPTGTSILTITILADGTVDNPQVIGSTTPEMDAAAKRAVTKWKFKPAMCGAEPVTADIRVEVNFRM
jgi:TonB family protein